MQVDLSQPLPAILIGRRYDALAALVKHGRQPLGWARVPADRFGRQVSGDLLAQIISEQLSLQIADAGGDRPLRIEPVSPPSASIVICTRENPALLERQLQAIAKIRHPELEVIVVDNAPTTSATKDVCAKFSFVRRMHEPRLGLAYARNTGWQLARNEIVAYCDDTIVDPTWLTALDEHFADAHVNAAVGVTFPLELLTSAQQHAENEAAGRRVYVRRVYKPGAWSVLHSLVAHHSGFGANFAVRRAVLEAMGGFDAALDAGSAARGGGDIDILSRLLRDGGRIVYEPRAIAWQQTPRSMSRLRRRMFDRGFGLGAYFAKFACDLELGGVSISMLRHWKRGVLARLKRNTLRAVRLEPHEPVHLILLELAGGLLGLPAYRRSVRRVRNDSIRFREKGIVRPLKAVA